MLTADQNAALDALASRLQGTPEGIALQVLRADHERLQSLSAKALVIAKAAQPVAQSLVPLLYSRSISIHPSDVLRLVVAIGIEETPATYEPIH